MRRIPTCRSAMEIAKQIFTTDRCIVKRRKEIEFSVIINQSIIYLYQAKTNKNRQDRLQERIKTLNTLQKNSFRLPLQSTITHSGILDKTVYRTA